MFEKTFQNFECFFKMIVFFMINKSILAYLIKYMIIELRLKNVIYIKKVSIFLSNAAFTNFFLLINFIYLVLSKVLIIV